MHTLKGAYRSESGRDIDYKVDFTVEGDTFHWDGWARLQGDGWTKIGGGNVLNVDPGLVEEAVIAVVDAAIEDRLRDDEGVQ